MITLHGHDVIDSVSFSFPPSTPPSNCNNHSHRMATSALLNSSTSSGQEQRHQLSYGAITDPQLSRTDNHPGTESTDTLDYGARSRSNTRASTARHSVLIAVPEDEQEYQDDDNDDDNASIISESSCSSVSSSCSSIESLRRRQGSHHHPSKFANGQDVDESAGSRHLLLTYVALTPVLLFIWGLFVGVLWLLPSSEYETIVAWGKAHYHCFSMSPFLPLVTDCVPKEHYICFDRSIRCRSSGLDSRIRTQDPDLCIFREDTSYGRVPLRMFNTFHRRSTGRRTSIGDPRTFGHWRRL